MTRWVFLGPYRTKGECRCWRTLELLLRPDAQRALLFCSFLTNLRAYFYLCGQIQYNHQWSHRGNFSVLRTRNPHQLNRANWTTIPESLPLQQYR